MAAPPERAAGLLDQLPRHLKGQLLQALVTVSSVGASRSSFGTEPAVIAADLRSQLAGKEEWGLDKAVDIVRELGDDVRTGRALAALAGVDQQALSQVQNRLFGFDDLMQLQDAELQVLMMQVDNGTLGRALQNTSEEMKKRLYGNMSARRRSIVSEEEELQEDATPEEIEEAHGAVMDAVRKLYQTRKIDTYFGSAQEDSRPRPVEEPRERAPTPGGGIEAGPPAQQAAAEPAAKPTPASRKRKSPVGAVLAGLGVVVLVALAWLWLGGDAPSRSEKGSGSKTSGSGSSGGARAGEMRVGSDAGGSSRTAEAGVKQTPVRQTRMTAEGKAVLDLPGNTRSEVEPVGERAQIYHEETVDPEDPKGLFMSIGRVRTTLLDEDFYVRTPVVKITGSQDAVFETRVVIDRTTYVSVESGEVMVERITGTGGSTSMTAGQNLRFDP